MRIRVVPHIFYNIVYLGWPEYAFGPFVLEKGNWDNNTNGSCNIICIFILLHLPLNKHAASLDLFNKETTKRFFFYRLRTLTIDLLFLCL